MKSGLCKYLEEVEASEYEYPNKIYKVPVKTDFFNHFVVAPALVHTIDSVNENKNVEHNTRGNVTAVETGDRKEVVEEVVCALHCNARLCSQNMASSFVIEEMCETLYWCSRISEAAPQSAYFAVKVCPLPSLAGKEAYTTDDCPEKPFSNILFVAIVTGVYCKHHSYRTHDEDKRHQGHE